MNRRIMISIFCVVAVLAVAVLLCALLFSVRTVRVHFGAADASMIPAFEQRIVDSAGYVRGKNILFLSESKLAAHIQGELEDIEVTNVVRNFPNTVTVEVNVRYPHAYVELFENGAVSGYAIIDNTARVRAVTTTQPADLIRVEGVGMAVSRADVGAKLVTKPAEYATILSDTFAAFARIGYGDFDCVALLERISVAPSSAGYDVKLETATGARIEILGTELYAEKIRYAVSAYVFSEANRGPGRVIRAWASSNKVQCTVNNSVNQLVGV